MSDHLLAAFLALGVVACFIGFFLELIDPEDYP